VVDTFLFIFENKEGISIVRFNDQDVMRHKLVKLIINAFEEDEERRQTFNSPSDNRPE
jgi:phosphate starvation-inducible protein PhoH